MAWVRSRDPVLAKIRLTWVLTVASLTNSARAVSRLDLPAAMRRSTSDSRGVRSVSAGPAAGGAAGARSADGTADRMSSLGRVLASGPGADGEREMASLRFGLVGAGFWARIARRA